jgi:copper(I)-binding protein
VPGSVAGHTEIHETVTVADSSGGDEGGRMMMRRVESIELPPGEDVQLKPGGYHVMLFDLKKPLKAGSRIKLTLILEKAGEIRGGSSMNGASARVPPPWPPICACS